MGSKYDNIRINTYIIRELYRNLKNSRNEVFLKNENNKRKQYISFSDMLSTGINKDIPPLRINRILKGESKSKYSLEEANKLANLFDISPEFFIYGTDRVFEVEGIPKEDILLILAKRFNNATYISMNFADQKNADKRIERAERAIEGILNIGYLQWTLDKENELYKMYYYFANGKKYYGSNIKMKVNNYVKNINSIKVEEWEECNDNDLELSSKILKRQFDIVNSIILLKQNR